MYEWVSLAGCSGSFGCESLPFRGFGKRVVNRHRDPYGNHAQIAAFQSPATKGSDFLHARKPLR